MIFSNNNNNKPVQTRKKLNPVVAPLLHIFSFRNMKGNISLILSQSFNLQASLVTTVPIGIVEVSLKHNEALGEYEKRFLA